MNTTDARISDIAAQMGVSYDDAVSFLACLRVWTDKGLSIEEAIAKNLETLATIREKVASGEAVALQGEIGGALWEEINGTKH